MKFRKKPVVIEATQLRNDNILQVEGFIEGHEIKLGNDIELDKFEEYENVVKKEGRKIKTLEGIMVADIGDWIIKGISGEFYPCKPDIFEKTYELVK